MITDCLPRKVKIIKKFFLSDKVVGFELAFLDRLPFSFTPGQFIMLSVLGFGEIPVAITISPKEKKKIEVAIKPVGMVTKKICSLVENDFLWIRGPFGVGFPLSAIKDKDLVLITGGIGILPIRSLIRYIKKNPSLVKSLTIMSGAKSPEEILFKDEYNSWGELATVGQAVDCGDSSWDGCLGVVDSLFDKIKIKRGSVVIACGPSAMYKKIVSRYAGKTSSEDDIYFLLERKMKCGIGRCQHCACGEFYVCTDGPVFQYSKIKYIKEAFCE